MADKEGLDVGYRAARHFLRNLAHQPTLRFLVQFLPQLTESLWRRDDRQSFEVVAEDALIDCIGRGMSPAGLFQLVEVGFLHCRRAEAIARLRRTGGVTLDFVVLAVGALVMRLSPEVDLVLVAMIAEEEGLAAVSA